MPARLLTGGGLLRITQNTRTDISPEQIEEARRLSHEAGMQIDFRAVPTEKLDFPKESFDVITACQCFWYFDHEHVMPKLAELLKPSGKLVILFMAWLPFEDEIAGKSEELVLKYSPNWTGAGQTRKPNWVPEVAFNDFELDDHEEYDVMVPFTKETWHGRMKVAAEWEHPCPATNCSLGRGTQKPFGQNRP